MDMKEWYVLNDLLSHAVIMFAMFKKKAIKRRGAYIIFRLVNAALFRGRRLFKGSAYLKFVIFEKIKTVLLFFVNSNLSASLFC